MHAVQDRKDECAQAALGGFPCAYRLTQWPNKGQTRRWKHGNGEKGTRSDQKGDIGVAHWRPRARQSRGAHDKDGAMKDYASPRRRVYSRCRTSVHKLFYYECHYVEGDGGLKRRKDHVDAVSTTDS